MEKCVACQYYDRNNGKVEDNGVRWGQCRRNVPVVHPVSAKAYMVEGIWPHVRDDDWCGEWTAINRKPETVLPDARNLMLQSSAPTPIRTAGLPPGSLMTPVKPATDASPAASNGRFGSD